MGHSLNDRCQLNLYIPGYHDITRFASGEPLLDASIDRLGDVSESPEGHIGVVAVLPSDPNRVVGYMILRDHRSTFDDATRQTLWIDYLAVEVAEQGKGIGVRLVTWAYKLATIINSDSIHLYRLNFKSLAFYQSLGLEEIDQDGWMGISTDRARSVLMILGL